MICAGASPSDRLWPVVLRGAGEGRRHAALSEENALLASPAAIAVVVRPARGPRRLAARQRQHREVSISRGVGCGGGGGYNGVVRRDVGEGCRNRFLFFLSLILLTTTHTLFLSIRVSLIAVGAAPTVARAPTRQRRGRHPRGAARRVRRQPHLLAAPPPPLTTGQLAPAAASTQTLVGCR